MEGDGQAAMQAQARAQSQRPSPASPSAVRSVVPVSAPGGAFVGVNALAPLLSGSVLRKFGRRGAAAPRAVRLSADALRVEWASRSKPLAESAVPVADMVALLQGQGTPNFSRFAGSSAAGKPEWSFSVVYRAPEKLNHAAASAEQRDAQLLSLRAGGYVAPAGGLRKGIRTLDLQASDPQQLKVWLRGLRLLLQEHQLRVEARHEERLALRREGMPNPRPLSDRHGPPHIPPPYSPPQQQEGENGPGEEADHLQAAAPYCPPPFSPSAASASSYSSPSPHQGSPHSPVMFGSVDAPASPRAASPMAAAGAVAAAAAASSPSAVAAAGHPIIPPVAEPYLPSIAACIVEMREAGGEFKDAELEGDCSARVYSLTADHSFLVCSAGGPSLGGSDPAAEQRIPIASIRNLVLDDSAAVHAAASGAYQGFLRFAFRDHTGSACGRMHHLSLASSNRFLLFLFHKGLRHLVERAAIAAAQPQQMEAGPPLHVEQLPASPRDAPPANHDIALAVQAAHHPLPLSPLAVPPPESPVARAGQRGNEAPHDPVQPAPANSPHAPLVFPLPLQPPVSPIVPAVILAPPSPPPPAIPDDLPSMIRQACRSELDGQPDWALNLAIVAKVAPQTRAQNEQLLSKHGLLSAFLRGSDHSSGLLALILFELLFENCNSVHFLPTVTSDASWMEAHFVKILPRWSRKPLESPEPGGLRGFFAKPNARAMELLRASEQTKLALLRWNKIKVIISSLANKREQGRHWYAAYEKLRTARAYDHPNAFPVSPSQQPNHNQQDAMASPRAVSPSAAAAVVQPRSAVAGAASASVSPSSLPDLLSLGLPHFSRRLTLMSSALSSLVDLLAAVSPHSHAFDADAAPGLHSELQHTGEACESHLQSLRSALTVVSAGRTVPPWMTEEHCAQIINQLDMLHDTLVAYKQFRQHHQQQQRFDQQQHQGHARGDEDEKCFSPPPPSIPPRPLLSPRLARPLSPRALHVEEAQCPADEWAGARPVSVSASPPTVRHMEPLGAFLPVSDADPAVAAAPDAPHALDANIDASAIVQRAEEQPAAVADAAAAISSSPELSVASPLAPLVPVSAISADLSLLSSRYSQFEAPIAAAAVDSYAADFFAQPLDANFLGESPFHSPLAVAPASAPAPAPLPASIDAGSPPPLQDADVASAIVAPLRVSVESVGPVEPIGSVEPAPDADAGIDLPSPRAPVVPPRPRNKSALTPRPTVIF